MNIFDYEDINGYIIVTKEPIPKKPAYDNEVNYSHIDCTSKSLKYNQPYYKLPTYKEAQEEIEKEKNIEK